MFVAATVAVVRVTGDCTCVPVSVKVLLPPRVEVTVSVAENAPRLPDAAAFAVTGNRQSSVVSLFVVHVTVPREKFALVCVSV